MGWRSEMGSQPDQKSVLEFFGAGGGGSLVGGRKGWGSTGRVGPVTWGGGLGGEGEVQEGGVGVGRVRARRAEGLSGGGGSGRQGWVGRKA